MENTYNFQLISVPFAHAALEDAQEQEAQRKGSEVVGSGVEADSEALELL